MLNHIIGWCSRDKLSDRVLSPSHLLKGNRLVGLINTGPIAGQRQHEVRIYQMCDEKQQATTIAKLLSHRPFNFGVAGKWHASVSDRGEITLVLLEAPFTVPKIQLNSVLLPGQSPPPAPAESIESPGELDCGGVIHVPSGKLWTDGDQILSICVKF